MVRQAGLLHPHEFVSANDIISGNSGSFVINQKAEFAGVISTATLSRWPVFSSRRFANRAVGMHTEIMTKPFRKFYGASALADKIEAAARQ